MTSISYSNIHHKRYEVKCRIKMRSPSGTRIIFANGLEPNQQNVGPDLDPNYLTL